MRWKLSAACVYVAWSAMAASAAAAPAPAAKPVTTQYAKGVPSVMLSAAHGALCKVNVNDPFPAVELPALGGEATKLEQLAGKRATVVCFWSPDRWMSRAALGDLAKDITKKDTAGGVAVIGIAVGQPADAVEAELKMTEAKFPQLLDADGKTLAEVGDDSLPRIYVLDAKRQIAWFDIEYSEATRRELRQTLDALAKAK